VESSGQVPVHSAPGRETVIGVRTFVLPEWRIIRGLPPRQLYGGEIVAIRVAETGNAALEEYAASLGREFRRVNNDRVQISGDEPYTIGFLRSDRAWPTSGTGREERPAKASPSVASFGQRKAAPGRDVLGLSPVRSRPCEDGDGLEDGLILERAVTLLLDGDRAAARAALRQLHQEDPVSRPKPDARVAAERPPRRTRTGVPRKLMATVFERDGWRCHYCGRRVVASGVIELIGTLCPVEFPFPPGHPMPRGRTHPAAERVYPNVDHVEASALGGSALDPTNLITACTPCNEAKSDRLGWQRIDLRFDRWDGLVGSYRALFSLAGSASQFHREWMEACGV
jgi:5-methylcytosine-specific restriction endonuclease McrA